MVMMGLTTFIRTATDAFLRNPLVLRNPRQPKLKHAYRRSSTIATATATTSTEEDRSTWYDLLVLGAGSGGVEASRTAAGVYGAKTCLVDMQLAPDFNAIGATSVEVKSVTKKLMVLASRHHSERQQAYAFGWQEQNTTTGAASHTFDWPRFMEAKNAELSRLNRVCQTTLQQAGVEIVYGKGRFQDPHTVIATHPTPFIPMNFFTCPNNRGA
jgi:hypothetical protein